MCIILLCRVLDELRKEGIETEMIQLAGQAIEPCKVCWACGGQQNCVHRRDSFREIFDKMKAADGASSVRRSIRRMSPPICRRFWSGPRWWRI